MEPQASMVHQEKMVSQATEDHKDSRVHKALLVQPDTQELTESQVNRMN